MLSERLINMPIQIVPAIYKIVLEELTKNDLEFDFFIIPSRKYEVNVDNDEKTNKKVKPEVELDYYHYEDQYFEENAKFKVQLPAKNGLVQTFTIIDIDGLTKSIGQLKDAINESI